MRREVGEMRFYFVFISRLFWILRGRYWVFGFFGLYVDFLRRMLEEYSGRFVGIFF